MSVDTVVRRPCVRWLVRNDMAAIMRIECEEFSNPWTEQEFIVRLRRRNCIGMVVEKIGTDEVVGFMLYELHKNRLVIENIAVDGWHHGQGYGRALVNHLKGKIHPPKRNCVEGLVRETNLDAQLFLKAIGLRCVETVRGHYDDFENEDAYRMRYPA